MTLTPLFDAGFTIASHAFVALAALVIGAIQLLATKGTRTHKMLGYLWCILMAWTAASSFWIHEIRLIGDWSPIHLLSALALGTIVYALYAARAGNITGHRRAMRSLYLYALVIAGLFTLLPGRIMHDVIFGLSAS